MQSTNNHQRGFTLIEMLIVIPFVLLVIAGLVVAITGLTGDSLGTRGQTEAAYEAQDALNRIEASVLRTVLFPASIQFDPSSSARQGKNEPANSNTQFTFITNTTPSPATQDTLILRLPATDKNSLDATREVLYATKSNCSSATIATNPIYPVTYVYFVNSGTLYERTIITLPYNDTAYTDYLNKTACSRQTTTGPTDISQRPSCIESLVGTANSECKTSDGVLATSVTNFKVTYLNKSGQAITASPATTTDPTKASGVEIELTISKSSGNKQITIPMKLVAQSSNL